MRIKFNHIIILLLFIISFSSCGKEDAYVYPPVKLEYLTAESGPNGSLQYVVTDDGERFDVSEDLSGTVIAADSSIRIVSNYEILKDADARGKKIKLYALLKTISPQPLPVSSFTEGLKTDPADVLSMWLGRDYLNITLSIKMHTEKHRFHFVEKSVDTDVTTGYKAVHLQLYHDAGNDLEAFTRRAYLSVPLSKYVENNTEEIVVYFSVNTYDDGLKTYRFDYVPSSN